MCGTYKGKGQQERGKHRNGDQITKNGNCEMRSIALCIKVNYSRSTLARGIQSRKYKPEVNSQTGNGDYREKVFGVKKKWEAQNAMYKAHAKSSFKLMQ